MALIPIFVLAALAMGQAAVAGYASWTAAGTARVGARAEALSRDAEPAVLAELPSFLRTNASIRVADPLGDHPGRVLVKLHVPRIVPGLDLGTVDGRAAMPAQGGG